MPNKPSWPTPKRWVLISTQPGTPTRLYAAFRAGRAGTGGGGGAKARAEAQHHRDDLTRRLTDTVKRVAAQCLRDEARAAAYFPVSLLQSPQRRPKKPKRP